VRLIRLIRAALLLVCAPLTGLGLLIYWSATSQFEPWHIPLVIGLIFGPLVALPSLPEVGTTIRKVGEALEHSADDEQGP